MRSAKGRASLKRTIHSAEPTFSSKKNTAVSVVDELAIERVFM